MKKRRSSALGALLRYGAAPCSLATDYRRLATCARFFGEAAVVDPLAIAAPALFAWRASGGGLCCQHFSLLAAMTRTGQTGTLRQRRCGSQKHATESQCSYEGAHEFACSVGWRFHRAARAPWHSSLQVHRLLEHDALPKCRCNRHAGRPDLQFNVLRKAASRPSRRKYRRLVNDTSPAAACCGAPRRRPRAR